MDLSKNSKMNSVREVSFSKKILGNARIKGIGKASLELSDNNFIIKSSEINYNFGERVSNIDFIIYSKGDFIQNDKMFIGIAGNQFDIECTENEDEFKSFYDIIKSIKGRQSSNNRLNKDFTEKIPSENNNVVDEVSENQEKETIKVSEEIRNFHNLMKDGIITEEEFEEKKKELLKL